jgi:hypothetical protein
VLDQLKVRASFTMVGIEHQRSAGMAKPLNVRRAPSAR